MSDQTDFPPRKRTPAWAPLSEAAGHGQFQLQVCDRCQAVQYPPREVCHQCLDDRLSWSQVASTGQLVGVTSLDASTHAFFRQHLPITVGLVKLDAGALVFAHLGDPALAVGEQVRLVNRLDKGGESVFIAVSGSADDVPDGGLDFLLADT